MLPRIRRIEPQDGYQLLVVFDNGERIVPDVASDIERIPQFGNLKTVHRLFENVRIDSSRTVVEWSDEIDLPGDTIYEYGQKLSRTEGVANNRFGSAQPRITSHENMKEGS